MSGVAQSNVVDLVAQDSPGRYLLIMVESRGWGIDASQRLQLMEKFNTYAGLIVSEAMARQYPEMAGKPVDIQLNCCETPTGEFATILDHTEKQLRRLGIGLRVVVSPHYRDK